MKFNISTFVFMFFFSYCIRLVYMQHYLNSAILLNLDISKPRGDVFQHCQTFNYCSVFAWTRYGHLQPCMTWPSISLYSVWLETCLSHQNFTRSVKKRRRLLLQKGCTRFVVTINKYMLIFLSLVTIIISN